MYGNWLGTFLWYESNTNPLLKLDLDFAIELKINSVQSTTKEGIEMKFFPSKETRNMLGGWLLVMTMFWALDDFLGLINSLATKDSVLHLAALYSSVAFLAVICFTFCVLVDIPRWPKFVYRALAWYLHWKLTRRIEKMLKNPRNS